MELNGTSRDKLTHHEDPSLSLQLLLPRPIRNSVALVEEEEEEEEEEETAVSSPNSGISSLQMELGMRNMRDWNEVEDICLSRKKLRLSKTQSAFLEQNFKENTTLNPKQKILLAKELNLGPRQVEVWFQNRRARTKLKQIEVDCIYLKRSCETLKEENKRLQKELHELGAFKTSLSAFYMQLPSTTLTTMCPSCETPAMATTTTTTSSTAAKESNNP